MRDLSDWPRERVDPDNRDEQRRADRNHGFVRRGRLDGQHSRSVGFDDHPVDARMREHLRGQLGRHPHRAFALDVPNHEQGRFDTVELRPPVRVVERADFRGAAHLFREDSRRGRHHAAARKPLGEREHQAALAPTADNRDEFSAGRETERLDDVCNFTRRSFTQYPERRHHRRERRGGAARIGALPGPHRRGSPQTVRRPFRSPPQPFDRRTPGSLAEESRWKRVDGREALMCDTSNDVGFSANNSPRNSPIFFWYRSPDSGSWRWAIAWRYHGPDWRKRAPKPEGLVPIGKLMRPAS